ncbi:MAG: ParB/RepB/Spo0J family partition protein, partial [Chloroflexota bacterium]
LAAREQLEVALIENIQRADLDAIEEATAYRQLIDEFSLTQDDVARRVGRARVTITNTLRLLDLDPAVQVALADGSITQGHARAIGGIALQSQARILATVLDQALSVRQTEELVRRIREPRNGLDVDRRGGSAPDPDRERVEEELRRALGTKVSVARSRRGGRIVIEYYSDEELGRLYERLTGGTA